jgi:ribosomal-protein-alanine N-acetyltransferase
MSVSFGPVVPILRMFDLGLTTAFYCGYLGCQIDWQDGAEGGPVYLQVSRGELVLHLSSHHDDGTPGGAVLIETRDVSTLHEELHATGYQHMLPGIEPHGRGKEMVLIDPASNRLRFFERTSPG